MAEHAQMQKLAKRAGFGMMPGAAFASRAHSQATAPNVRAHGARNQMAAMLKDPGMRLLMAMKAVPPGAMVARGMMR